MLIGQEHKLDGLVLILIYTRCVNGTRLRCIWSLKVNLKKSSNRKIL